MGRRLSQHGCSLLRLHLTCTTSMSTPLNSSLTNRQKRGEITKHRSGRRSPRRTPTYCSVAAISNFVKSPLLIESSLSKLRPIVSPRGHRYSPCSSHQDPVVNFNVLSPISSDLGA